MTLLPRTSKSRVLREERKTQQPPIRPRGPILYRGRLGLNSILPNPNEHASQGHVPRRYRAERPGPWTERLAPTTGTPLAARDSERLVANTFKFHATGMPVWKSNVKLGTTDELERYRALGANLCYTDSEPEEWVRNTAKDTSAFLLSECTMAARVHC